MPVERETTIPRQKQLLVVGTRIKKVKQLDFENARKMMTLTSNLGENRRGGLRVENPNGSKLTKDRNKHVRSKLGWDKSGIPSLLRH